MRIRHHARTSCLLGAAFAITATALAQGPPPQTPELGKKEQRADLQRRLQRYRLQRLQQILRLSEAQLAELTPIVQRIEESRRQHQRGRRRLVRRLADLIRDPEEANLEQVLGTLRDLESSFRDGQQALQSELDSHLNLRQRAQYVVFHERFNQEIRNKLRELKRRRRDGSQRRDRRNTPRNRSHQPPPPDSDEP